MAEAFLRHQASDKFDVFSAGLEAAKVDPLAIKVMEEIGMDMTNQESKNLNVYFNQRFSYLITVCDKANKQCPIFPGVSIRENWPFDDPAASTGTEEERLVIYRKVRDEIKGRIEQFLAEEIND
jgi:arsenate reductase